MENQHEMLYSVGETANYCGVSTRTLRYYDELGLVKPERVDAETGYRYYGDSQIDRLRLILILKEVGMSLDEIKLYCQDMNSRKYLKLLEKRRESLRRQIEAMKKHLKITERYENDLLIAISSMKTGACFLRIMDTIEGYYIPAAGQSVAETRLQLRRLERASGFGIMPGSVLRIVSEENLRKGEYINYSGYLVRNDDITFDGAPVTYPERLCAVTYCPVPRPDSGPHWERLIGFINEHNFDIAGDAFKKIILEKGITSNDEEYISMLCIPIKAVDDRDD